MTALDQRLCAAKAASRMLAAAGEARKNDALSMIAQRIEENADRILLANAQDVDRARGSVSDVMIDRLLLTRERIFAMASAVRDVMALEDPIGKSISAFSRPNGLQIEKITVPLGVIAIIYESRPNVTLDAAVLCFKSSNVAFLRPGKEAYGTSVAIVDIVRSALTSCGFDENCVCIAPDTSREGATALMQAVDYVDALIPRGGAGLIRSCVENAKVPCIQTGTGICHVFVDESAELEMAISIIENAKVSRPSVCNAMEVLLVHEKIAERLLPMVKQVLVDQRRLNGTCPVELRLSEEAMRYISGTPARKEDFDTEFLDYILSVSVVRDIDEAIEHIDRHSTHHSECIVTNTKEHAQKFTERVDSAAVYVNASTRFTDGGEFGKGCEIGISTQKMHARGPMGLEELTSYKYVISGNGQIR